MSEDPGSNPPSPPTGASELRFTCPHCQMELTAPLSAAGVVGPCPQCRGEIQAPPVPSAVARRKSEVPMPAVLPPRVEAKGPSGAEEVRVKKSVSGEVRVERRVRKRRANPPQDHREDGSYEAGERREAIALIKVVLAILLTLVVTLVICWIVWKGIMENPIPPAILGSESACF